MAQLNERPFYADKEFINPDVDDFLPYFKKNYPEEAEKYKIIRRKLALNEEQRNELLEVAYATNPLHYLIIRSQMETGMRVGEVANLIIVNCVLKTKYPFIAIQPHLSSTAHGKKISKWHPKSKKGGRDIHISPDLAILIGVQIGGRETGYVFISQKDSKFSERSIRRFTNQYAVEKCKSLGFKIGTHTLRRTFASFQLKKGKDIGSLKNDLGHKDIKTTMKYLFEIEDMDEKIKTAQISDQMHDVKTSKDVIVRLQEKQLKHEQAQQKRDSKNKGE